jgi:hypothetical protein
MGETVNRGSSGKFERRTRFGWLKFSNRRSRNRGVEKATVKAGDARAARARMAIARVVAVVEGMIGAGIVGIAEATVDASKVRRKSIWRN